MGRYVLAHSLALLLVGPVMAKYIVAGAHTVHLRVDRKQRQGTRNTPLRAHHQQ